MTTEVMGPEQAREDDNAVPLRRGSVRLLYATAPPFGGRAA